MNRMKRPHVVFALLLVALALVPAWAQEDPTIAEIASLREDLDTLTITLGATGLIETLNLAGPFTVFAPSDAAFARLPDGTLGTLTDNPEVLEQLLRYHVVPGTLSSEDLREQDRAFLGTTEGSEVQIRADDEEILVNSARVVEADIRASNGVVHLIDTVLFPPTSARLGLGSSLVVREPTVGSTLQTLQGNLLDISPNTATAILQGWQQTLRAADDPLLTTIAIRLESLENELLAPVIDRQRVSALLREVGELTSQAALTASPETEGELLRLGAYLTRAGRQLQETP